MTGAPGIRCVLEHGKLCCASRVCACVRACDLSAAPPPCAAASTLWVGWFCFRCKTSMIYWSFVFAYKCTYVCMNMCRAWPADLRVWRLIVLIHNTNLWGINIKCTPAQWHREHEPFNINNNNNKTQCVAWVRLNKRVHNLRCNYTCVCAQFWSLEEFLKLP